MTYRRSAYNCNPCSVVGALASLGAPLYYIFCSKKYITIIPVIVSLQCHKNSIRKPSEIGFRAFGSSMRSEQEKIISEAVPPASPGKPP